MKFLNRKEELTRLKQSLSSTRSQVVIVYGRRRIGKTRLLKQLKRDTDIYFIADQRETPLQIKSFASVIASIIKGFDQVIFPGWDNLFNHLIDRAPKGITLFIDEFPYLVKNAPELPSLLQRLMDNNKMIPFNLVLCGSSQKMMHDLVIDSSSPLYGRADNILKIEPLQVYWIKQALSCSYQQTIEEYSIWGGVPRYWELRLEQASLKNAVIYHVFDHHGVLHDEPLRLFIDDTRDTVQMFTLISLIASGVHRLSEIAARVEKPSTSLIRPLQKLIELGYIIREIPFGISNRNTKKSLYKIADPFINFYFRYVIPEKSLLEMGHARRVYDKILRKDFPLYCSSVWETLCRKAIPALFKENLFAPGQRWWGRDKNRHNAEIDIVSISHDKKELVIGEVKWSSNVNVHSTIENLKTKVRNFPFSENRKIHMALFLKEKPGQTPAGTRIFTPEDVVETLG